MNEIRKTYKPRLTPKQVTQLRTRHRGGEKIKDLAVSFDRSYSIIQAAITGTTYPDAESEPEAGCGRCGELDTAADNMVAIGGFRGHVKCIHCPNMLLVSADAVKKCQGRIACSACCGGKS